LEGFVSCVLCFGGFLCGGDGNGLGRKAGYFLMDRIDVEVLFGAHLTGHSKGLGGSMGVEGRAV
jgi:hypothetical protein